MMKKLHIMLKTTHYVSILFKNKCQYYWHWCQYYLCVFMRKKNLLTGKFWRFPMVSLVKYRKSGGSFDNKRKEKRGFQCSMYELNFTQQYQVLFPNIKHAVKCACAENRNTELYSKALDASIIFIRPSPVFSSCGYLVNITRSQLLTITSQLHYSI